MAVDDDFDEYSLLFGDEGDSSQGEDTKKPKKGKKPKRKRKQKATSVENDDTMDDFFGEETSREQSGTQKNRAVVPLVIVGVLAAVIAGVSLSGNGDEEQPPPVAKKVNADLQLVNLQQVAFADNLCSAIDSWGRDTRELEVPDDQVNPVKARKMVLKNIAGNIDRIKELSKDFDTIPEKSLEQAQEMAEDTVVTDNNLKVGGSIDEKVASTTKGITSSFRGYASAVDDTRKKLSIVANYNFNGIRDELTKTQEDLKKLNGQLSDTLGKTINEDAFDNTATLVAVSQLESCQGILFDYDQLSKEKGKEISDMKIVSDIAVKQRCEQYMDNTKSLKGNEVVDTNRKACGDFLQSVTIDQKNPLARAEINTHEDQRIDPPTGKTSGGSSEDSSEDSKGNDSDKSTDKSTASTTKTKDASKDRDTKKSTQTTTKKNSGA